MKILVDECTGPAVAKWLTKQGHQVFSVYEQARGKSDDWIIEKAFKENWVLLTNDKDFGEKVFQQGHPHDGIILLRLQDERAENKIQILKQLLNQYSDQILGNYLVVTEKQVRIRRPII